MSRAPWAAPVGWKMPNPPRSTVLLLLSRRCAKPTRGLMLFRSVLINPRPTSNWSDVSVRPSCTGTRRQQRANGGVRHDVMAAVGGDEVRVDVVPVDEDADHLVPQPQEQRQPGIQLDVVLREHGPVVRERVHRQVAAGIALLAHFVGQTEQEVGERVARRKSREGVRALRLVRAGGVAVLRVVAACRCRRT